MVWDLLKLIETLDSGNSKKEITIRLHKNSAKYWAKLQPQSTSTYSFESINKVIRLNLLSR
jgi:hypothetical protein